MKGIKRKIAAVVMSALVLGSCGETGLESYEHNSRIRIGFSWWGKDVRHNYTTEAIDVFESQNDDISVYPEYAEWLGFKDRMDTKMGSGTQADVMQMNFNWLYEYTGKGYSFYDLRKLEEYIDLNNFDSNVLEYGTIDGKLLGIPISMNAQTVYLNKSLFDKYNLPIPETWEDYFAAADVMQKDGIYILRLSKSSSWHFCIAYAEQKTGKRFFDEQGNVGFGKEDMAVLFDFYKQMTDKGVTVPIDDRDRKDFEDGKAAGTVMWISDAEYYVAPCRDKGNEIVVADYPAMEGASVYGWYAKPTSLYCISESTEHPQEAARFISFLLCSEEMTKLRGLENGVPVCKSALEVLAANDMIDGIQLEADEMRKKHTPSVKLLSPYTETSAFMEKFDELNKRVYNGETDVDTAAGELYDTILTVMGNNN